MASYGGSPFEAGVGPTDTDVVLFAACPPPEELGFEPATGHWRKQLHLDQVEALWVSRPVGSFRGEPCMVLDDLGDRLHIGYLGHDGYKAEQLGYWQVDRGVFELVAPRAEVADVVEQQADYTTAIGHDEAVQNPVEPTAVAGQLPPAAQPGYDPAPPDYQFREERSGVTLPVSAQAPLPLEAQAMRAASASRRTPEPAPMATPVPDESRSPAPAEPERVRPEPASTAPARAGRLSARGGTRRRLATEQLFAELASQAGIPASSYSIGKAAEGAFCLVHSASGVEVFHCADGAHHEVQVFTTEESACFYLFGMLAADAVRAGRLVSMPAVPASL
ncbi:MAG TPA: hypothetical protein VGI58_16100 [Streptosporangiaceae bacterium]